jgi:ABC-2 type transport system ATP-binding protein
VYCTHLRMVYSIVAQGLRKRYGDTTALDGLELAVPAGTVCGLLGPNGAGKTTAVRVLTTLLRPDGGRATVAGYDVCAEPAQVRSRIGLTVQHDAVDDVLTGRQNLVMFGRLFHLPVAAARRRADELLEQFGLAETADRQVKHYSGGMRRRLDLAAGFILAPDVLFLDEPTTGQDPHARNEVWEVMRSLVDGGTTVLLTTHYLDEADQLADRIVVIDRGSVIAEGAPEELKARIGGSRVELVVRSPEDLGAAAELVGRVGAEPPRIDRDGRRVSALVHDPVGALTALLPAVRAAGIAAEDVGLRRPTLDDVFLRLTGQTVAA